MQMVADGDPVQHVAVSAEQFQQRRLAGQDQFQGRLVVEGRTDQQAKIGEGLGLEQVGLVQQDQQRPLGLAGMVADLAQELVFAPEGRLPQVTDQQPQQVVAGELGQVHVAGLDTGPRSSCQKRFRRADLPTPLAPVTRPSVPAVVRYRSRAKPWVRRSSGQRRSAGVCSAKG